MTGNPVVTLNRAVAAAMVDGPVAGLAVLDGVEDRLAGHYRARCGPRAPARDGGRHATPRSRRIDAPPVGRRTSPSSATSPRRRHGSGQPQRRTEGMDRGSALMRPLPSRAMQATPAPGESRREQARDAAATEGRLRRRARADPADHHRVRVGDERLGTVRQRGAQWRDAPVRAPHGGCQSTGLPRVGDRSHLRRTRCGARGPARRSGGRPPRPGSSACCWRSSPRSSSCAGSS